MDRNLNTVDFAVELSQASPTLWNSQELSEWRERFDTALGKDRRQVFGLRAGMLVGRPFDGVQPADYLAVDFVRLQSQVIRILRIVSGGKNRGPVHVPDGPLRFAALPYKRKSILIVSGAVDPVFLYVLIVGLTLVPNVLIRKCPNCHSLLRAVGKRRFCSDPCKNKVGMDRYIARRGPEGMRQARRRHYERRLKGGTPRPYRPQS